LLPEATKPRYLMGIGSLREMAIAVAQGIEQSLFDCVLPTHWTPRCTALAPGGAYGWNLRNARFSHDHPPPFDARLPRLAAGRHSSRLPQPP